MEGQLVVTQEDHSCGKCPEIIPAGSEVMEIPVQTTTPNPWGNERPIVVKVRYHPLCWEANQG